MLSCKLTLSEERKRKWFPGSPAALSAGHETLLAWSPSPEEFSSLQGCFRAAHERRQSGQLRASLCQKTRTLHITEALMGQKWHQVLCTRDERTAGVMLELMTTSPPWSAGSGRGGDDKEQHNLLYLQITLKSFS